MVFREIDDDLWAIVRNYLPPTKPHIGRPRCDPCGLFNGILYVLTSQLYEPTLEAFEIPGVQVRPTIISADAAYDAREIRQYDRKRGVKTNIPVNKRSQKHPKRGRPTRFDPGLYKKHSAIERFFSWIQASKKIVPRYERYEHSFSGLIRLVCVVMIGRILG